MNGAQSEAGKRQKLTILMPVMDDWESAAAVIARLDEVLAVGDVEPGVLLVDDGSDRPCPGDLVRGPLRTIESVDVLKLRRNLGHQRAIAVGLTHIHKSCPCDAIVVMDADGEDRPEDVLRLLAKFRESGGEKVVFASRLRRSEGPVFATFYFLYRTLHRLLTGIPIRVGNFSILGFSRLGTLVVASELWNHYAAAVHKLRLPLDFVPAPRGSRLAGRPKMNYVSLVTHGLSAISVFAETVGTRILIAVSALIVLCIGLAAAILYARLFTPLAIPGWATSAMGLVLIIMLQALMIAAGFLFFALGGRNNTSFIPLRDCEFFIDSLNKVYDRSG